MIDLSHSADETNKDISLKVQCRISGVRTVDRDMLHYWMYTSLLQCYSLRVGHNPCRDIAMMCRKRRKTISTHFLQSVEIPPVNQHAAPRVPCQRGRKISGAFCTSGWYEVERLFWCLDFIRLWKFGLHHVRRRPTSNVWTSQNLRHLPRWFSQLKLGRRWAHPSIITCSKVT